MPINTCAEEANDGRSPSWQVMRCPAGFRKWQTLSPLLALYLNVQDGRRLRTTDQPPVVAKAMRLCAARSTADDKPHRPGQHRRDLVAPRPEASGGERYVFGCVIRNAMTLTSACMKDDREPPE